MFNLFKKKRKVVTRIAPSPTGIMHIGTARTALFNYLFAKQNKGKFILRIEDTDRERSKKEYENDIVDIMNWLSLNYNEFHRQSERTKIYKKYIKQLIDSDHAYISKEPTGEREEVIRFRNPNKEVVFKDIIRGEIKFNTTELGDFVIAKSLDEPLYHLAVVVDDLEMAVTHIIRGEDVLSNTPRQILIWEAFGAEIPQYAHLPLILGKDKGKLSKRHGAVSVSQYRERGYLKEALINYIAFLGWNPGDEREVFDMDELIKEFNIKKVSKGGAVFNLEKLNWFNREHIKRLPIEELNGILKKKLQKFNPTLEQIERTQPLLVERIFKFSDIDNLIESREVDFYFESPDYDPQKLIWKDAGAKKTSQHLKTVLEKISDLKEFPISDIVRKTIWDYADTEGRGEVLWPLRYALSGLDKSPDPFSLISVLGIKESIQRIESAIERLNELGD